jgi:hypothetical protein
VIIRLSVCLCNLSPSTFEWLKQFLRNLICISWHLNPSQRRTSWNPPISLCVYMCTSPIVARQRLSKNITAATNTRVTIEEILNALFSLRFVSYEGKVVSSSQNFFVLHNHPIFEAWRSTCTKCRGTQGENHYPKLINPGWMSRSNQ